MSDYRQMTFKYFAPIAILISIQLLLFFCGRYVGVFNTLPKTAYIKMIDIWFIFCMIIPFLEVTC